MATLYVLSARGDRRVSWKTHDLTAGDPEALAAIAEAEAGILRSNVPLGGVAFSPDQANRMVERGYRALALGFDWLLLQRGAASVLDGIRR